MPTRAEIEQEVRRSLSRAAESVHVEDRWDELVDRIESGAGQVPVVVSPRSRDRQWKPVWVFAAAFVTVVVVIGLSGLQGGRAPQTDSPLGSQSAPASETTLAEPSVVWPPAIPTVDGQTDAVWHCPEVDVQPDEQLDPAQVPNDLRYLPAGDAPVRSAWGVNYGPGCAKGPALVAVTFANAERTTLSSVVVVWVELPNTSHHWSAEPPSVIQGSESRPGDVITDVDEFIVRRSTAGDVEVVEAVGVIDELPVWIESSGITPDRLLEVARQMTASPQTGRVQLAETSDGFEVVHSGPVNAEVTDHITWYAEGPGIGQSLEITPNPGFNPYEIAVGFTNDMQFIEIAETTAVLAGEEGGTQRLTWEIQPGIEATVVGEGSELVQVAESLTQVDANDPRFPTD